MTLQTDLQAAVTKSTAAAQKLHDVVHGNAASTVETDNGPVKTVAKTIADNETEIAASRAELDQKVADAAASAAAAAVDADRAEQAANSIAIPVPIESGGTGATTAPDARTALGLGTVAVLDVGAGANQVVQLDAGAKLPAVDGSQLTNLPIPPDDRKTIVSGADTTPGYLSVKLQAGAGISLTTVNPGADEKVEIASAAAASAVQGGVNVGGGADVFKQKNGANLEFRRFSKVAGNNVETTTFVRDITVGVSGDTVQITALYGHAPSGGGFCFLPGTLVRRADSAWVPIETIALGDRLDGGPFGPTTVLALHKPKIGARWLWDLGPIKTTGDHLFLTADGRWGAVEPALYSKLREAEFVWLETQDGRRRARTGAVPSREIVMLNPGLLLHGGDLPRLVRCEPADPELELIGFWTDVGAYVVEGGFVADGLPQR
jgi:hypothetical protein